MGIPNHHIEVTPANATEPLPLPLKDINIHKICVKAPLSRTKQNYCAPAETKYMISITLLLLSFRFLLPLYVSYLISYFFTV